MSGSSRYEPRDSFGGALRIDRHGLPNLRERDVESRSAAARNFRSATRLRRKSDRRAWLADMHRARRACVALGFVGGREIEPGPCGMRIKRERVAIRARQRAARQALRVVLPVAAEEKPRLGITRLELHGTLVALARFDSGEVRGERVATARITESGGEDCGDEKKCGARDRAGEAQNHSTVLCLSPARGCKPKFTK